LCAQTAVFFNDPGSKKCGNYTLYVWRAVWCLPNGFGIRVAHHFGWRIFLLIKVCQQKWLNLWRRPNLWRPPEISLISVKPQQSLSLPLGALLKSRKNTTDHCCCPISAVILTTSELEANLKNQPLASVYMHVKVGGRQGCREGEREVADHMTALIWL
jgi:hypothetical protein